MSLPARGPIWLDEARERLPTRPCRCGRPVPIYHYRLPMLRFIDAALFRVTTVVEWCGHQQEGLPVPAVGGGVELGFLRLEFNRKPGGGAGHSRQRAR